MSSKKLLNTYAVSTTALLILSVAFKFIALDIKPTPYMMAALTPIEVWGIITLFKFAIKVLFDEDVDPSPYPAG